MRHVWLVPAVYAAAVLKTACDSEIVAGVACPDSLGLTIVAVALLVNSRSAVFWAALIGLVSDCLTPDRLGIDVMASSLVGYGIVRVRGERASRLHVLEVVSIVLAAISCLHALSGGLRAVANRRSLDFSELVLGSCSVAVSTAVLALALMAACFVVRRLWPQRAVKLSSFRYHPKPPG